MVQGGAWRRGRLGKRARHKQQFYSISLHTKSSIKNTPPLRLPPLNCSSVKKRYQNRLVNVLRQRHWHACALRVGWRDAAGATQRAGIRNVRGAVYVIVAVTVDRWVW